jgi:hypothetical protein
MSLGETAYAPGNKNSKGEVEGCPWIRKKALSRAKIS